MEKNLVSPGKQLTVSMVDLSNARQVMLFEFQTLHDS
jgi:hypothetical protein